MLNLNLYNYREYYVIKKQKWCVFDQKTLYIERRISDQKKTKNWKQTQYVYFFQ